MHPSLLTVTVPVIVRDSSPGAIAIAQAELSPQLATNLYRANRLSLVMGRPSSESANHRITDGTDSHSIPGPELAY